MLGLVNNYNQISKQREACQVNQADLSSVLKMAIENNPSQKKINTAESSQKADNSSSKASEEKENPYMDEKTLKRLGLKQCNSCSSRTYKDKSDDSGVSFKGGGHISPAFATGTVVSHEQEHVIHEKHRAVQNRQIAYQTVQLYTDHCPECGRAYTSGGKTTTNTISIPERQQVEPVKKEQVDLYV